MILVDFNQTAISTFMAETRGRNDIEVNVPLLRHMIINAIRSYKKKFGNEFGEIVIACDNRYYWRRTVYPHYKAARKKAREDSGHDWHSIFEALHAIRQELDEYFPYPVIDVEGAEADDVIGALAEYSQTQGETVGLFDDVEPKPFLIISSDHDFRQLQKFPNVKQFSPMKKGWVKIDCSPEQILTEHIIKGDKGDGIPNILSPDDCFVEGKRQKPIRKVLLDEWKKKSPDEWVTSDMAHNYNRNSELVDLAKTPDDIKKNIINSYEKQQGQDKSQLLNYFIKYRMKNMIDVLEDF